jgi:hypothetical protein
MGVTLSRGYPPSTQHPGEEKVSEGYVWVRLVSDDWEYTERVN